MVAEAGLAKRIQFVRCIFNFCLFYPRAKKSSEMSGPTFLKIFWLPGTREGKSTEHQVAEAGLTKRSKIIRWPRRDSRSEFN